MKQIIYLFILFFIFFNTTYGIDTHLPPITNAYHNNDYSNREPFANDFLEQPRDGTIVVYGNGNGNNKEIKDAEKAYKKWLKDGNSGSFEYFLTNVYYNIPIGDYWIILLVFVLMYIIYIINNKPKQNK